MPTRNIILTDRQAALVEHLVKSGRYQNAGEVLREGLRLVEQREAENEARLHALREAARVGIEDIDSGRYTTFETAADIQEHIARLTERASRRDAERG